MTTLNNNHLRVSIRPQGAELTSIFHKSSGIEHLWQADPLVWPWHGPNLFPVVGGCLNNQLLIDGQAYPMERHGFTRRSMFETTESSDTHAVFTLRSSDVTRVHYPYEFLFQVIYEIDGPVLTITYRVVNEDDQTVYFQLGAHPAFTVPFRTGEAYEDYFIEFENEEPLQTHRLTADGYFSGETESVPTTGNRLMLTKSLFDRDALVLKNISSRRVTLQSQHHNHALSVSFSSFPYLGLWAKPGANFVCIEPWLGCADSDGELVPIEQKELIQQVASGKVFEATLTINVE
ncbi:aldose 1-epimerase family protein [Spirosoma montaniterrae]|uniref:Aldose epimerase n=1 Tax=Spirosoma montaniterrae TaxID=1178516 RepID=A0A1P9X207_9BACT|nr:aldose 1-epimerase family protein [Spirosoma montaniterrae]AQG81635.1 aldose epimerase [Spirosoma montaniterrae]